MIKTVEAIVDERGNVKLLEPLKPGPARRAFLTILEEGPSETALLSEAALAEDWNRPEEDIVFPAGVDFRALRRTEEHSGSTRNTNEISDLDQQGASSLLNLKTG